MLRSHPVNVAACPACWGDFANCAIPDCVWRDRCARVTVSGVSIAEALAALPPDDLEEVSVLGLLRFAADTLFAMSPMTNRYRVWSGNTKYLDAMQQVIRACAVHRVDPRQWIRAQLEWLTPHIQERRKVSPGHFFGPGADRRWEAWSSSRRFSRGSVHQSHVDRAAAHMRLAALSAYARGRLRGDTHTTAHAEAATIDPTWDGSSWTPSERLRALAAAISDLDPGATARISVPPQWTWDDVAALGAAVYGIQANEDLDEGEI